MSDDQSTQNGVGGLLSGKTAIATGASSGIARTTALTLAQAGAAVVLFARRQNRLGVDEVSDRFGICLGDSIVPYSPFLRMHDPDYPPRKGFDNRVGMALVIQTPALLGEVPHPNMVWGTGTVQDELGIRGARTDGFSVNADIAIVLEGTPADDLPGIPEDERQGAVGRGMQIRLMDPSALMNRKFAQYAMTVAEARGCHIQLVSIAGSMGLCYSVTINS